MAGMYACGHYPTSRLRHHQVMDMGVFDNQEESQVSYLSAIENLGRGDMVGAIALLTKAIALNPDYADAYQLRGETLLKMGDVKGANNDVQWLLNGKEADKDEVLLLKARIEHAGKNLDNAITYYNKVIENNPQSIEAFRERGAIYLEKGDMDHAAEDAAHVLELDPQAGKSVNGNFKAEGTEDI